MIVDLRREFENPCPHLKTLSLRRSRGFYNHDQRSSEPTVSDSRGRVVRSLGMAQTLLCPEQVDDLVAQYREGATPVELVSHLRSEPPHGGHTPHPPGGHHPPRTVRLCPHP